MSTEKKEFCWDCRREIKDNERRTYTGSQVYHDKCYKGFNPKATPPR